jgi:nitrite reductase/ring-hydroxylating ferredoxin subunit
MTARQFDVERMPREEMRTVQQILDDDTGPAPAPPLRESAPSKLGTADIPIERYVSREFLALEYERLWSRVWQWACNEEDIPNVGDHTVYEIGDRSVFVVRSAPDAVKAFHNSCRHRGRQLKSAPGNAAHITCPFHSWSWNLDGSLRGVPCRWDFPQVGEGTHDLVEVRTEIYAGFVFLTFDNDAEPLAEALDVIPEHFKHFPLDRRFTAAHVSKLVAVNWKAGMDAFLESYHVMSVHPQIVEFNADLNTQYDVWHNANRMISPLAEPSPALGPGYDPAAVFESAAGYFAAQGEVPELPEGVAPRSAIAGMGREMMRQMLGVDLSSYSDSEIIDGIEYFVFPNWFPWAGIANGIQYRFRPYRHDPDVCIMDVRLMFPLPPGPRPLAAPVHHLGLDEPFATVPELLSLAGVLDQDVDNMEAMQRGMKTAPQSGLVISDYQEARIRHYHQRLDEWIGG